MRSRIRKRPLSVVQKALIVWVPLTVLLPVLVIFVHEYFYWGFVVWFGLSCLVLKAVLKSERDCKARLHPFKPIPRGPGPESMERLEGRSARARKKKHNWKQPPRDDAPTPE